MRKFFLACLLSYATKHFFKLTLLPKEKPFTQFNVAFHRRLGIRLSFEYTTTLLSEKAGEGRTGTGFMFEKMLCEIVANNRGRDT